MEQSVIIKSSKNGITLVLDSETEFERLLSEILLKFQESGKFFANARVAISFEGRDLSDHEKYRIVDSIMSHTSIKILCIIEQDERKDEFIQKKIEEQARAHCAAVQETHKINGPFYYGSFVPGEQFETDESIIILGNVPKGSTVISKSSIVVLGQLEGAAYSGVEGAADSFIAALWFAPEKHNIAGINGTPIEKQNNSISLKRNKTPEAKIAFAKGGLINIRPLYEGLNNYL